ncbi:MAG: DUF5698 domain-containing protein [Candidatus Falkowbacteria bacterium]
MTLFFIGILEMLIVTAWTKVVAKSQIMASGIITWVNILIWYYVLQAMVNDLADWYLAMLYATGCAVGTIVTMWYFSAKEKNG